MINCAVTYSIWFDLFLSHVIFSRSEFVNKGVCIPHISGQFDGMYSLEEMQNIASALSTGQLRITRLDKVDNGMLKYLARVQQNCHVVICMSNSGK